MKWSDEASQALTRVPFFVRKRVRRAVEQEAAARGENRVTLEHVRFCQERFLKRMEEEVRGYRVESCFASGGCPNQAVEPAQATGLPEALEDRLREADLRSFLKTRVAGTLKLHHEFRIAVAGCPNACSRPQIADIGLIGACTPEISGVECSRCGACLDACRDRAVILESGAPVIDRTACVRCGDCVRACPTGALAAGKIGYRILIGGKLGRHPRLGAELPGLHDRESVSKIVESCLGHFRANCLGGERFGEILERTGNGFILPGAEDLLDIDQGHPAGVALQSLPEAGIGECAQRGRLYETGNSIIV